MPPYDEWEDSIEYYEWVEHYCAGDVWESSEKTMDAYDMAKGEDIKYKVGDLVQRKSVISSGAVGVITRVDEIATESQHGKKYLVTLQKDGEQVWLNQDQLDKME